VTDELLLMGLEAVAARLGVAVRYEPCEGRGGMCTLRGRRVLIIDDGKTAAERAEVIARGLAELDLEAIYVPPAVREAIEGHRGAAESG
jgi:hypothetical protein